jgi:hypothetical protein
MARYSVINDLKFLEFTDLETGEIISVNKASVREVRITPNDPYLFIIYEGDVGDHRFRYDEVIDPDTGQPFTSLLEFKEFILDSVNDTGAVTSVPLGSWDPNTNTPVLADGAMYDSDSDLTPDTQATANQYFVVSAAGTYPLDGNSIWEPGDYVRSNGSVWFRVESSDTIPAVNVIYEDTNVQEALDDIYSRLSISELDDTDVAGVTDGQALIYDETQGKWVPGTAGSDGRILLQIVGFVEGDVTEPTVEGLYILDSTPIAGWIPGGAVINDILEYSGGAWSIHTVASLAVGGSLEVWFDNPPEYRVNFVWDGLQWTSYNAYVPNSDLEDVQVSNPIGDISTSYTGGQLKYKSFSWLFDNMLFITDYTKPLEPTLSLSSSGGNIERGSNISGIINVNYTQNGAGSSTTSTTEAIENGLLKATKPETLVTAVDLDNINGYSLRAPGITNQTALAKVTINYSAGDIPEDNKGNQYPADQIQAGSLVQSATYTSRYPIWIGTTSERFTIQEGEESTSLPLIAPNDGSNLVGVNFDESWMRANLSSQLFISNLSDKVDTIQVGDVHCFVACPTGISVSKAEIFAAGAWVDWPDFVASFFTITVNDANSINPRTYKVHFVRSIAGNEFNAIQDFRFSTTGTVTP